MVDGRSAWFEVAPARWTSDPVGRVHGERVIEGSVGWLVSAAGVHRARFAFALAPGAHVVGFGERFDALDQRGRTPGSPGRPS